MPTNKNLFELTILGCSGGPISGKTCSFLLKPTDVSYNSIINGDNDSFLAIDAGTGLTSMVNILKNKNEYLKSSFLLDLYSKNVENSELNPIVGLISTYINTNNLTLKTPFEDLVIFNQQESEKKSNLQIADKLLNSINAYLITHSHLDHVTSLVINSPAFSTRKIVFGLKSTMDSIHENLFNGIVWPDLVLMNIISLNSMETNKTNSSISQRYSITPFQLSHGIKQNKERYISTAFLINDLKFNYNILFFGDVESDIISNCNYNLIIWKYISPLIINDELNSIIIECSTVDKPPPLFGHMIPSNLIYEFSILRKQCIDLKFPHIKFQNLNHDNETYKKFDYQPLDGLNVIIIHVKETLDDINPRYLILNKLNSLNLNFNLKINFTMALSGLSFVL